MKLSELNSITESIVVKSKGKIPQELLDMIEDAKPKMLAALGIGSTKVSISVEDNLNAAAHGGARKVKNPTDGYVTFSGKFLKDANKSEVLNTLAHELIHVWQGISGKFDTSDPSEWYYDTKKYNSRTQWKKSPWEHEAVLNSWRLVQKAGLDTGKSHPVLNSDHWVAMIAGKESNRFIKHLDLE